MRNVLNVLAVSCLLYAPLTHAQSGAIDSGCINSPENPTAILALVGAAGGGLVALQGRLRRRK